MDKSMNDIKVKDAAFAHGIDKSKRVSSIAIRDRDAEYSFRFGHQWTVDQIDWNKVKTAFQSWQLQTYGPNTVLDKNSVEVFDFIKKQIELSWKDLPKTKQKK